MARPFSVSGRSLDIRPPARAKVRNVAVAAAHDEVIERVRQSFAPKQRGLIRKVQMQVRPRAATAESDLADNVAAGYALARHHADAARSQVFVDRVTRAIQLQHDVVAAAFGQWMAA